MILRGPLGGVTTFSYYFIYYLRYMVILLLSAGARNYITLNYQKKKTGNYLNPEEKKKQKHYLSLKIHIIHTNKYERELVSLCFMLYYRRDMEIDIVGFSICVLC